MPVTLTAGPRRVCDRPGLHVQRDPGEDGNGEELLTRHACTARRLVCEAVTVFGALIVLVALAACERRDRPDVLLVTFRRDAGWVQVL